MSDWVWGYEGYDPDEEKLREALCTVGNGYIATRGAAPECEASEHHYPGTYVGGIYNRLTTEIEDEEVDNESLVNLPNWLVLTWRVDRGPWFGIDAVELLEYHQELDVRRAVLVRRFRFRDRDGRTTAVTQRRFASMDFEHACALETTLTAEDWSGDLEIRSVIDGRVTNDLVERYRDLAGDHLDVVETRQITDDSVLLVAQTNQSRTRVAMAARTQLRDADGDGAEADEIRLFDDDGRIGQDLTVRVHEGRPITVEKTVAVFTGRDRAVSEPGEEAARWIGRLDAFEDLLTRHVTAWHHLWERFHVDMRCEADVSERLRIVRLHLLHLLQTVSPNTTDHDVGVPPRGLHGEAYRGHVLWDEIFVLPVLDMRIPALARTLLLYRYRRLPEARRAALEAGHAGAMYPWQSGSDGREESQTLHLNPMSGRWNPDPTDRQRHVGSAIAYNVWSYYESTADREFLDDHGTEMLVEIARFWASIARYDRGLDRYSIRGVMGPDEFHSGYPDAPYDGIDDNAYTNVMAVWVLLKATAALELVPHRRRRELEDVLGLSSDELERWDDITRKMYVPFHDDGIISQFEGYEDLEELDWDAYRERYGDIQRLDRILEAEDDTVNRYKASKQADVLMLFYLLSSAELEELFARLGYRFSPEMIPANIDYYLARTSHGSTLSALVHAWVLTRAHREDGLDMFDRALRSDVVDIQGGTTHEGIHLAAMAGTVDLLQRCFSGLERRGERLILNPYWPTELGTLEFAIRYRGHPLTLRIAGTGVEITAGPGTRPPIEVVCRGEVAEVAPGSKVSFPS